ncbi:hypothetical protein AXF42_Ash020500 [Apostasia shenzhenica]|uniref:Uncharacterized protein n=1 Tax=Apostasia shenzhenica TaxID=1088818 RepID=A0A2H9ZZE3_9ASPA|nr:hypothetical protein AXF42_Ash020500 [Apostasia shenzhenica]
MATCAGCLLVVLFLLCATIESSDATDPPAGWVSLLGIDRVETPTARGLCHTALRLYLDSRPKELIGDFSDVIEVLRADFRRVGPMKEYGLTFSVLKQRPAWGLIFNVIISLTLQKYDSSRYASVNNVEIMVVRGSATFSPSTP